MRLATGLLVGSALVMPGSSPAATPAAPSKAEVQKLLHERDDARHKGDWAAYGKVFTTDATVINSDNKSYRGRAEIEKGAEESWGAGVYKGAKITATVESLEAIAPNVAAADATYEITNIGPGGTRKG